MAATSSACDVVAEHEPLEALQVLVAASGTSDRGPLASRLKSSAIDRLRRRGIVLERLEPQRAAPGRRPGRSGTASTSRTRPAERRGSEVSIFMLSTTATTSPASTSSPDLHRDRHDDRRGRGCARCRRRRARCGAGRRRPRRAARVPAAETTVRYDRAARRSAAARSGSSRSISTSTRCAVDDQPVAAGPDLVDARSGRRWPRWRSSIVARRPRRPPAGGRAARGRRSARGRSAVAASASSIAACERAATSACRTGTVSPRSCRPVEPAGVDVARRAAPARSSSSSRKPWFVVPPSTTTIGLGAARGAGGRAPRRGRAPQAMTLAIIESNSAGMTSPSATPVSTRMPGPGRQPQQRDRARGGREAERRVLGVQPRLDGVADGRRRLALEPPAGGDVELELDEVERRWPPR